MFWTQVINCQLPKAELKRIERNLWLISQRIFYKEYSNRNIPKIQVKCLTETGPNPT